MATEFTLKIPACGPIKQNGEKGRIIINFGAGSSYGPAIIGEEECKCDCPDKLKNPPRIYDLKRQCPDEADQQILFAWDCETSYEAEDAGEARAHDDAVRPGLNYANVIYPQKPVWVSDCKKCKCKFFIEAIIAGNAEEETSEEDELYSYDIKQKNKNGEIIKQINVKSNGRGRKKFGKLLYRADVDENGKAEDSIKIEVSFAPDHTGTGKAEIIIEVWDITPEESYIIDTKTGPESYDFSCKV